MKIGDVVAVSRYWTPAHVDVTFAPLNYAKPKAGWLERLQEMRLLAPIDDTDRARRRALHRRTVVEATEVRALPPIESVPLSPALEPEPDPETRPVPRFRFLERGA